MTYLIKKIDVLKEVVANNYSQNILQEIEEWISLAKKIGFNKSMVYI